MRVVGGVARGRRLTARVPPGVRPTTDFVREAIFNVLASRRSLEGSRVVDLYCGTGALGIEALSRGAAHCTFVDDAEASLAAARSNLRAVGLDGDGADGATRATFTRATLPGWHPAGHVDVVLCDPPYGELHAAALLRDFDADVVVIETDAPAAVPEGWETTFERRYGGTLVTVLEHDER